MYILLLKVYCSSFSAVAAGMFVWMIINLLRNKDESLESIASAFKSDKQKRKGNMESTVRKFTMESIVHITWKEYENYNMGLAMPQ